MRKRVVLSLVAIGMLTSAVYATDGAAVEQTLQTENKMAVADYFEAKPGVVVSENLFTVKGLYVDSNNDLDKAYGAGAELAKRFYLNNGVNWGFLTKAEYTNNFQRYSFDGEFGYKGFGITGQTGYLNSDFKGSKEVCEGSYERECNTINVDDTAENMYLGAGLKYRGAIGSMSKYDVWIGAHYQYNLPMLGDKDFDYFTDIGGSIGLSDTDAGQMLSFDYKNLNINLRDKVVDRQEHNVYSVNYTVNF